MNINKETFGKVWRGFVTFLAFSSVTFLVSVLVLSSVYSPTATVFHAESQKNDARQINGLQAMAVNKSMQSCLYGTDIRTIANSPIVAETNRISHIARYATKQEVNNAIDNAEAICSDNLIQKLSVANPEAGGAVIYLLKQQNFKMDPKYLKYGKQDAVALASVNF